MPRRPKVLRRRALKLEQTGGNALFLFSIRGDELLQIAEISRVSRSGAGKLIGYQRPETKKHINDIVTYLNSDDVIFPNSLILAFSSKVRFVKSRGPRVGDNIAAAGTIEIPVPQGSQPKPAWIVDGQQRALAISRSKRSDLPIAVNAFIAETVDLQRDQFLRVNNTKSLPRGLITELLPTVSTPLPAKLAARKIPSSLCNILDSDSESPFYGMIKRPSTSKNKKRKPVVSDSSIVTMLEESLTSASGCLFPYRNIATGETDFDWIRRVLFAYWSAVMNTFHDAWGKPPNKSRLMHGAGIRAMGKLMDRVMATVDARDPRAAKRIERDLQLVAPLCRWTEGRWEELDGLRWNEIQNVPRHIRVLSNYLIRAYVHAKDAAR